MIASNEAYIGEKMYETRLRTLGQPKNLKPDEALAMARVKARRDVTGMTTEFWRGGKLVGLQKLERYIRLHPAVSQRLQELHHEDTTRLLPIEAILPPHIIALSPASPLLGSEAIELPEKMCLAIQNHMDAGFSSGTWFASHSGNCATRNAGGSFWEVE